MKYPPNTKISVERGTLRVGDVEAVKFGRDAKGNMTVLKRAGG